MSRSWRGSQSEFPLLTPNVPFQGVARRSEYKFLDCIQDVCVFITAGPIKSCSRGGRRRVEHTGMCYEIRPAETVTLFTRTCSVCVFITAGPMIKLCAGGEGDSEGHVL